MSQKNKLHPYQKTLIEQFDKLSKGEIKTILKHVENGCPTYWPDNDSLDDIMKKGKG